MTKLKAMGKSQKGNDLAKLAAIPLIQLPRFVSLE
jgi:hypothetical protein